MCINDVNNCKEACWMQDRTSVPASQNLGRPKASVNRMPAVAIMHQRPLVSSASLYHTSASELAPRRNGSNPKSPAAPPRNTSPCCLNETKANLLLAAFCDESRLHTARQSAKEADWQQDRQSTLVHAVAYAQAASVLYHMQHEHWLGVV